MTHGSLFSGIGGFDLAAEWVGWENVFHCEWNPFGQRVLKYYWPNSISYNDITQTDFTIHRGGIDILTGGFPCQPYSSSGKRLGKDDERHLWPEMLRAIREVEPRWIVGENVLGIVNWSEGLVFEEVQSELENEGYEVQAYILPAASVGAPHIRKRVFFVARNTNTDSKRLEGHRYSREAFGKGDKKSDIDSEGDSADYWSRWPTVSPFCDGDDGLSNRLDGITFPKWRKESIMAGGNAVVPQLVLQIFKTIEEYKTLWNKKIL